MLEFLSGGVADIMRKMAPPARKPRGRPKGSDSTLLQCSRMHFCRLVQLYRICSGAAHAPRTQCKTKRDRRRAIQRTLRSWEKAETRLWNKAEILKPAGMGWGTGRPREWWTFQEPSEEYLRTLCEDISILKALNKSKERREKAADIRASVKRREELAASGRMKKVISSILGKAVSTSTVDVIDGPEGPITDQEEMHGHLTGEWEAKFQHPAGSLPYMLGLEEAPRPGCPLPSAEMWEYFISNPRAMKEHLLSDPRVKVPEAMIDIIVDAFTSTPGRGTAEEEVAQAMAKPFTVAEMRLLIRKKSNTAPGLTELTYQMLGFLPDKATSDLFKLMERMWGAKHVPEFWKLKGLIGIPKTKVVTGVNDLRPIGHIERTRKLWTTMVTRRILGVLRRRLQDNHCGGLANKGTDTALIQLISLLEDLEDVNGAADHEVSDAPLDFMSWDTAKAFDSVGNHVQYAAWRRLEVPVNIASWLMNLDLGGFFVIMMPHSRKTLDTIRMSGP
jgi:hypothetical protein